MAFDQNKDKRLVTLGRIESGGLPINAGIHSYDGGEAKLGLNRILVTKAGTDDEKTYNRAIGRMNEEEVVALVALFGFDAAADAAKVRAAFTRAKKAARKDKRGKKKKAQGKAGDVIKPTTKKKTKKSGKKSSK